MDIVITAKDTKHVTFPYGGNLGYMPPDHQGFGITSKNGQETRYTVPSKHWGTLRGFPLEGLELPIAVVVLKKLEQHPKKTPVESIIWVRENNEYTDMLTTWGITPGTPVKDVKQTLRKFLTKHTDTIEPAGMIKITIQAGDMRRVTLWNGYDPTISGATSTEENTGFTILTKGQEHHYAIPAYLRCIVHDFRHEQASLAQMLLTLEHLDGQPMDTIVTEVTLGYRRGWEADCLAQWFSDIDSTGVTVGQLRHLINSYVGMLTVPVSKAPLEDGV